MYFCLSLLSSQKVSFLVKSYFSSGKESGFEKHLLLQAKLAVEQGLHLENKKTLGTELLLRVNLFWKPYK